MKTDHELLRVGMEQVLNRGTGTILKADSHGQLVHDSISDAWMIDIDDTGLGTQWMDVFIPKDCHLIQTLSEPLMQYAHTAFQLDEILICHQAVLQQPLSQRSASLTIRPAELKDIPMIESVYDKVSDAELRLILQRGNLFIGYDSDGHPVGFVGQHLEGNLGLLEVFPDVRRHGYGVQLEGFMLERMKGQNLIPFCQVEAGNEKSLALQQKLGMTVSSGLVYWLYRGTD